MNQGGEFSIPMTGESWIPIDSVDRPADEPCQGVPSHVVKDCLPGLLVRQRRQLIRRGCSRGDRSSAAAPYLFGLSRCVGWTQGSATLRHQ